jgi:ATP-dependent DNA helicase RecQ
LVTKNLVAVDFEGYGALKLAEACRPVLRGEQTLMLRQDAAPEKTKTAKDKMQRSSGNAGASRTTGGDSLWEALRRKRLELAQAQNVPAYIIFQDDVLREMAEKRPRTLTEMATIPGIGEKKLKTYGSTFLNVLMQWWGHDEDLPFNDTVLETLTLFRQGHSVAQIAEQRSLKDNTIYVHLATLMEEGMLTLEEVVDLSVEQRQAIESAFANLPEEQANALKPVFDQFQEAYSYGVLRCVKAAWQWRQSEESAGIKK